MESHQIHVPNHQPDEIYQVESSHGFYGFFQVEAMEWCHGTSRESCGILSRSVWENHETWWLIGYLVVNLPADMALNLEEINNDYDLG